LSVGRPKKVHTRPFWWTSGPSIGCRSVSASSDAIAFSRPVAGSIQTISGRDCSAPSGTRRAIKRSPFSGQSCASSSGASSTDQSGAPVPIANAISPRDVSTITRWPDRPGNRRTSGRVRVQMRWPEAASMHSTANVPG
jgi:hypothetical protein